MREQIMVYLVRLRNAVNGRGADPKTAEGARLQIDATLEFIVNAGDQISAAEFREFLYIQKNNYFNLRSDKANLLYTKELTGRLIVIDQCLGKVQDIINETGEVAEGKKILAPEDELKFRNFVVFER